jgi:hypothetical protein
MVREPIEGDRAMRIITTLVIGVALLGTITFAQSTNYDFDKTANFAGFRTYAWIQGAAVPDRFSNERIITSISSQLALKRLTQVERNDNPDLLVAYHAAFDRNLEITGFSTGWGGYRFPAAGGYRSGMMRTNEIVTGTLIVDLVDARTKTIVWRGTAEKDINPNATPDQRDKNINRATDKLFKNYPPRAK